MATVKTPVEYQVVAAELASRARREPAFRKKLASDPVGTLKAAGIGADAVRELISEDAFSRGRLAGAAGDCTVTCICTDGCCVTCWIGSSARVREDEIVSNPERVVFGRRVAGIRANPVKADLVNNLVSRGHISISGR